jgi:hypothetical protein
MKKNGERLSGMLENALLIGEVAYQANRRALRDFDVREDVDAGNAELDNIENGIDKFIQDLQGVSGFAREIARHASSFL